MSTNHLLQNEMNSLSPKLLVNNAVADSWQTRVGFPLASMDADGVHQDSLDLVGHTLNGRPIYRAWQLALLLGISPALLSTSLGSIPTNLRPFEIFDEDYEANAGRLVFREDAAPKKEVSELKEGQTLALEELRRLAVLARTTELAELGTFSKDSMNGLLDSFKEF